MQSPAACSRGLAMAPARSAVPPRATLHPRSTLKPRRRLMRGWPITFRTTYEASSVRRTVIGPLFSPPQGSGGGGGRDGPAADTHNTRTLPEKRRTQREDGSSLAPRPAAASHTSRPAGSRRAASHAASRPAPPPPGPPLRSPPGPPPPGPPPPTPPGASELQNSVGCRLNPPQPARRRGCPARLAGRSITDGGKEVAKLKLQRLHAASKASPRLCRSAPVPSTPK